MGGVVKKGKKLIRKAIPKEIRPALPFAAAYFGPKFLTGDALKFATANPNITRALIASGTSAAQGDDTESVLRSGVLAAAPGAISKGLGSVGTKFGVPSGVDVESMTFAQKIGEGARSAQAAIEGASPLQTIGAQSAIQGGAQLAQIQQDQIDEYNRQLQEQGVMNKVKRRQGIYDIYISAGYDPDYVNSVLDKYGYADGGIAYLADGGMEMFKGMRPRMRGFKAPASARSMIRKSTDVDPEAFQAALEESNDDDEDKEKTKSTAKRKEPVPVTVEGDLASGLAAAAQGVERAFGRGFGNMEPVPMLRFAKGGEVEEEEVSESGIMTVASAPNNFAELNMLAIDLFGRPYDQLTDGEQETLMDFIGSKSQAGGKGIMQMASGYKSDIEEMYEQYVFEMEEMGLQPMSFSEFLAQARSGMAKGGDVMSAEEYFKEKGKQEKLNNMERMRREYEEYKYKKKYGPRNEAKDGGIMEKDMRGGGFIPEGSKERADDVPARLSKNEFVMTADAVRAAGGGSVNKGAKRMYDLMYTLEGKI